MSPSLPSNSLHKNAKIRFLMMTFVVLYCSYSTVRTVQSIASSGLELRYRFGSHFVLEAHRYLASLQLAILQLASFRLVTNITCASQPLSRLAIRFPRFKAISLQDCLCRRFRNTCKIREFSLKKMMMMPNALETIVLKIYSTINFGKVSCRQVDTIL